MTEGPISNRAHDRSLGARTFTLRERLLSKVNVVGNCWEWRPKSTRKGAVIWFDGKAVSAARASYVLEYGEVPADMELTNRCQNQKCISPFHMYLKSRHKGKASGFIINPKSIKTNKPLDDELNTDVFSIRRAFPDDLTEASVANGASDQPGRFATAWARRAANTSTERKPQRSDGERPSLNVLNARARRRLRRGLKLRFSDHVLLGAP